MEPIKHRPEHTHTYRRSRRVKAGVSVPWPVGRVWDRGRGGCEFLRMEGAAERELGLKGACTAELLTSDERQGYTVACCYH